MCLIDEWRVRESYLLQLLGFDVDLLVQRAVGLLQLQSLFVAVFHLLLHLPLPPFLETQKCACSKSAVSYTGLLVGLWLAGGT